MNNFRWLLVALIPFLIPLTFIILAFAFENALCRQYNREGWHCEYWVIPEGVFWVDLVAKFLFLAIPVVAPLFAALAAPTRKLPAAAMVFLFYWVLTMCLFFSR